MTAIVMMNTMTALIISVMSMIWPLISIWPASTPPPRKTPTSGRMRPAEMAPMSAATRGADDDGDREVDEVAPECELPESLEHGGFLSSCRRLDAPALRRNLLPGLTGSESPG